MKIEKKTRRYVKCINEYIEMDDYSILKITSNTHGVKSFLLDKEDVDRINQYQWNIFKVKQKNKDVYYASTSNKSLPSTHRLLHRLILLTVKGKQCDHIDGNTLDTRKFNLRECTQDENLKNRKKPCTNKSGVKGVYWADSLKTPKWLASIKVNNKSYHLGYYDKFEDAVEARKQAEIKYQGEFSRDYGNEL